MVGHDTEDITAPINRERYLRVTLAGEQKKTLAEDSLSSAYGVVPAAIGPICDLMGLGSPGDV